MSIWKNRFRAAIVYRGTIDCSTNPNYPAAILGDLWVVSVAGKIGGASGAAVEVGDSILCKVAVSAAGTQAAVGANWNIVQANVDGVVIGPAAATDNALPLFNGTTGKLIKDSAKTIVTTLGADDTTVPTSKAVKDVTDNRVVSNVAITPGTFSKVTVDAKGLVTLGATASLADITNAGDDQITIPAINGNGFAILVGEKGDVRIPWAGTITGWLITSDISTTSSVQIWKDTWANYPPTVADLLLTASLTAQTSNSAASLSHSCTKGDMIRVNVSANDNATRLQVWLVFTKS